MIDTDVVTRINKIYNSVSENEQIYLKQILKEVSETGESKTYDNIWLSDYTEIPVDIDTFLESDLYLGKATRNGKAVYPYWRNTLRNIFNAGNKFNEIIFTGATRIGKTSTAITGACYMLYRLMCLTNPQEFFNKKEVSKFSILFFNVTKELAKGVAFTEFNSTLQVSPWFNEHGRFNKSEQNPVYIPDGNSIVITYGSESAHALGQQVFCAVLDEANFSKAGIQDVQKAKKRVMDTYNTISTRITGTFSKGGEVYGKMFTVSSKNSDSDFIEAHIEEQLSSGAGDGLYVCDSPQWEVKPSSEFSKEKFAIAVGDRHMKGFVVPDNQDNEESLSELQSQGYKIMHPPRSLRPKFVADFDIALRDIAGISVPGALSFITQESLTACITDRKNPFINDILSIGTKDNYTIEEFFHKDLIESRLLKYPWFIHLDLSLTTDRTGISAIAITDRKQIQSEDGKQISLPFFTHIFSIALEAPRGDKIPYAKITEFLCWLRSQGINIEWITRDQFQSEYMAQLLEAQGFDVDKISLDRTPDGYMALRSIILEQRLDMLDCKLLQDELVYLQRDAVTGRVDHTVGRSKDLADSFAGAIWKAMIENPATDLPPSSLARVISSVNTLRNTPPSTLGGAFARLYNK